MNNRRNPMATLEIQASDDYHQLGAYQCILCGSVLKNPKLWLHMNTDGDITDERELPEVESMGFHPIGTDCSKSIPKEFIFRM